MHDRLPFVLDEVAEGGRRQRGLHQVCGRARSAGYQAALLSDNRYVAAAAGVVLEHVAQAAEIDLARERTQQLAVILADRHGHHDHRFADRGIPGRVPDECVARAQIVQLIL